MNSQNTKAIGGSNCHAGGASTFQPNQMTVQPKMARKNPIEPTRTVIQSANRSSGLNVWRTSLCTLRKGRRRLMTSSTDGGGSKVAGDVALMAETPSRNPRNQNRLILQRRVAPPGCGLDGQTSVSQGRNLMDRLRPSLSAQAWPATQ